MTQTAEIYQFPPKEAVAHKTAEVAPRVKADTDNGWFKVSTVLSKAECCVDLGKYESKIYHAVKAKTHGYHKSFDYISGSQYEEITKIRPDGSIGKGVPENKAKAIEKRLVDRKILIQKGRKVSVNTVVSEWDYDPEPVKKAPKKAVVPPEKQHPIKEDLHPLQDILHPLQGVITPSTGVHNKKDNNNKIITKDIVGKPDSNSIYFKVISYLNFKTNKNFKNIASNQKFINGRIREGYTLEDFKTVIDHKTIEWLNNPKMNEYLRPKTLFNADNFQSYLNSTPVQQIGGGSGCRQTQNINWSDTSWANDLNSDEGVTLI